MAAIYTGVTQTVVNVGDVGWGLVLGWSLWFIILLAFLVIMRLVMEPVDDDNCKCFSFVYSLLNINADILTPLIK